MATKLFLRNTQLNGIGSTYYDMVTTAGSGTDTAVVNTQASGTEIQFTKTAGGSVIQWVSGRVPSGGFTLTTTDISGWLEESNMSANAGGRYRVFKRAANGTETELGGGPFDDGVEFGNAGPAEMTWTGNVTDTAFAENDRILLKLYITNIATMGGGFTCTLTFNGADAATGDSFFNIAETVAFKAEDPPFAQNDWPNAKAREPADIQFLNPSIKTAGLTPDTTNLPTGAGWGPPKSQVRRTIDPNSWLSAYYPQVSSVTQRPFVQADWPNPQGVRRSIDLTWVNASRDLRPPFFQNDWSNPRGIATKDGTWINPGILQVAAAQAPFNQTDWSNPRPPRFGNLSFAFTLPLPTDTTTYMPASAVWLDKPSNRRSQQQQQEVNRLPLTSAPAVTNPFSQFDWPNPRAPKRTTELLTWINGLPPIQYVFRQALVSAPKQPRPPTRDHVQPLNLSLVTAAPQTPPIRNYDWPLACRVRPQTALTWTQSPFPPPTPQPFAQTDWPNPKAVTPQSASIAGQNTLPLSAFVQPPFRQDDWVNPRVGRRQELSHTQPFNLLTATVVPFNQTDWPNPKTVTASPSYIAALNLPIATGVSQTPFNCLDWPNARGARPSNRDYAPPLNILIATVVPQIPPIRNHDFPLPRAAALSDRGFAMPPGLPLLPPPTPPVTDEIPHHLPFFATMGQLKSF